ncbi:NADPH-dependent FMN reductase [Paenibacillus sp. HB172176]|uniref:NADPH-dependent FMN reductase n=1 Tax=Paenibacillus sp. HB172176 TaxID=2493690 RepID=UPI00143A6AAA|nr:NADPH-dependent FMN reductase [Paenibacillus sp. HB172176]
MKIVIITGSNRKEASSTHLSNYVGELIHKQRHDAEVYNLYENPLPFYSPDGEYEDTAGINALKQKTREADAIVLASPEYHSSITGVLKNALDHLSKEQFSGKAVLSMSSAAGAVGTSSLQHLQGIVRNLHGINLNEWISIGGTQRELFHAEGLITDDTEDPILDRVKRVTLLFLDLAEKLAR